MKFLFRWLFRLLVLLIILAVAAVLVIDPIARAFLERRLHERTGMDVEIGKVSVGLLSPTLTIRDLKMFNTADFGGSPFLDLPELHVEYDLGALRDRRVHFRLVRLDLEELGLVQDKQGRNNFQVMMDHQDSGAARSSSSNSTSPKTSVAFGGIDTLNLTLGKVTMLRLDHSGEPKVKQFGLRNQILSDLQTSQEVELKIAILLAQHGGFELFDFFPAESPAATSAKSSL